MSLPNREHESNSPHTADLTPEEYELVGRAFEECIDATDDVRHRVLTQLGEHDTRLREEVESLLAHAPEEHDVNGADADDDVSDSEMDEFIGTTVGSYRIQHHLATGGMGRVYTAEQEHPRRLVALKVLRRDFMSDSVWKRFEQECEILGRLNHRGIANIIESGICARGGHEYPFYAMELVEGARTILAYADQEQLGTKDRLRLMIEVCEAVHEGHLKGVMHRDLKPANILVDRTGQPKIIDFGVARVTNSDIALTTMETSPGQLIGTLAYMSPEQCEGDSLAIDARADVYSLGVILYELMCGQSPYDLTQKMLHEAVQVIREEEPRRLSTVSTGLRGDIETIVGKALAKDRDRRYASAAALAEDIQHFLSHEPITARPPSTWYQLSKFTKRNKTLVTAAVLVLLVSLAAAGVAIRFALSEQSARLDVQQKVDELEVVTTFQQSMLSAIDAASMGDSIIADLREQIQAELVKEGVEPGAVDVTLARFDEIIGRANPTNVALDVVDEHVLARAVAVIERDFEDRPILGASLQQAVSDTYVALGLFEQAIPLQTSALEIRRREMGDMHEDTLGSINNMGGLLDSLGKLSNAETYYREALRGFRQAFGDDDPRTLLAMNNLGAFLSDHGNWSEAEAYLTEALETRRRTLGEHHPDTLASINNMGALLVNEGKLPEAEPYFRKVLEILRSKNGDTHRQTLTAISNLGYVLVEQQNLKDGELYHREALEGLQRVLGHDHVQTLAAANNLGFLLVKQGKLAEAEPLFRAALEGYRRTLGDDHIDTLRSINNLGVLLHKRRKLAEAESYLHEALEGIQSVLGEDHAETSNAIYNMGWILAIQDKFNEAEPYFRQDLQVKRRRLGNDHFDTLVSVYRLAGLLTHLKSFREAEPLCVEFRDKILARSDSDKDRKVTAVQLLMDLYTAWDEAEPGQGHDVTAEQWRAQLDEISTALDTKASETEDYDNNDDSSGG